MKNDTRLKAIKLCDFIVNCITDDGLLLVAYSGGIDSAYLAWIAHQQLQSRMLAVLADSPSLPRRARADAISFARKHEIPLEVISTGEMDSLQYRRNDEQRCFHCKDELFRAMSTFASCFANVKLAYGRNLDDNQDFRPGQLAAAQHEVLAPLAEASLTKQDIRTLAKAAGLSIWDKPAAACLASRVEYLREVTPNVLSQIERAEDRLHELGFKQIRVRHHGDLARIEIGLDEMHHAFSAAMLRYITAVVKEAGFNYVAVDTSGYRSGSMNDLIPASALGAIL